MRSRVGSSRSGWSSTGQDAGSCTARTAIAAVTTRRSRSRSAATRSAPEDVQPSHACGLHELHACGRSGEADGDEPPSRSVAAHRRTTLDLHDLAAGVNLVLRGWFGYVTAFYPSAVIPLCQRVDRHLVRWARWKYKRLERSGRRAWAAGAVRSQGNPSCSCIGATAALRPASWTARAVCVERAHVQIVGGRRVRFPPATRRNERVLHRRTSELRRDHLSRAADRWFQA